MTYRFVSPTNAVLPEQTGVLVGFVRDPKKFKLNNYVQLVNSPGATGVYHELDRDRPIRVVSDAEFAFEDGDEAPTGNTNKGNFQMQEFRCQRRAIPFTVGEEAAEAFQKQGAFDPILFESQSCASQAMVLRTKNVMDLIDTSGAWGSYTDSATNLGGGKWDAGTSTAPYLKKGLLAACRLINFVTNGVVQISDLRLILNPIDAIKISASAELHDYIKSSKDAEAMITGELRPNPNELWGLPRRLYGVEVVVEDAVSVSTRNKADGTAGTRGYLKSADSALLVSRAGGIDAPYGSKSFSTVQLFYHKYEMSAEMRHDNWNKRHEGRVIDWYTSKIVAAPAGYFVSDIIT